MSERTSALSGVRGLYGVGVGGALAGLAVGGWLTAQPAGPPRVAGAPGLRISRLEPARDLRPRSDGGLRLADLPRLLTRGLARRWTAADARGELECLTEAVYYEARGEPVSGQAAVAQVVLNRTRAPGFPRHVCGVVF